jgi:NAD(P)-dependent dehydrogenase (short-subunit alcohol dehydrogenase family)
LSDQIYLVGYDKGRNVEVQRQWFLGIKIFGHACKFGEQLDFACGGFNLTKGNEMKQTAGGGYDFTDRVAVIFGAGGGMGEGLALELGRRGARLLLSDYEDSTLQAVTSDVRARGGRVVSLRADISKREDVDAVRDAAIANYGDVDLVFNTVGVAAQLARVWEISEMDWRWNFDVNFWGVLHTIRSFVPLLIERGKGHILNTSSTSVMASPPGTAAYVSSKHAVVGVSEILQQDLRAAGSDVRVSIIFPGAVRSKAASGQRNRQPEYGASVVNPEEAMLHQEHLNRNGTTGEVLASRILSEVSEGKFYIFGRAKDLSMSRNWSEAVVNGSLYPPPGDLESPFWGVYGALA